MNNVNWQFYIFLYYVLWLATFPPKLSMQESEPAEKNKRKAHKAVRIAEKLMGKYALEKEVDITLWITL